VMAETILVTLHLAAVTTVFLMILGVPLAWWLATTRAWYRDVIGAVVTVPLVLPPTVLGFYLLIAFGPDTPLGRLALGVFGHQLPFSFEGLVVACVVASFPFVVQPVRNGFEALGPAPFELAATLRAGPWRRFFTVALPLNRAGIVAGAVLAFAHTVGEFGVVLMIGGNIPAETRVISLAIYDHVENLEWAEAHWLAGGMVGFSFLVIVSVMSLERSLRRGR